MRGSCWSSSHWSLVGGAAARIRADAPIGGAFRLQEPAPSFPAGCSDCLPAEKRTRIYNTLRRRCPLGAPLTSAHGCFVLPGAAAIGARGWRLVRAQLHLYFIHPPRRRHTTDLLCRRQRVAAASWTILSRSGVRDTDWERREGGLSDGPMLSVEVIECTLHAMGGPR